MVQPPPARTNTHTGLHYYTYLARKVSSSFYVSRFILQVISITITNGCLFSFLFLKEKLAFQFHLRYPESTSNEKTHLRHCIL